MRWLATKCRSGDMVRVKIGMIWHYGVYASDNEVIQFGMPPGHEPACAIDDIRVCSTDIQTFSCGGFVEAAQMSLPERINRIPRRRSVARARARIGEGGYDLIHNNCEHFAYECVMGVKRSVQEEQSREMWRSRRLTDIYVMRIPNGIRVEPFIKKALNKELKRIKDPSLRVRRYCAMRLLLHALDNCYGYSENDVSFKRCPNGKLMCDKAFISVAYADELVAAAVSSSAVGIDIETENSFINRFHCGAAIPSDNGAKDELHRSMCVWTRKVSAYKRSNAGKFIPDALPSDVRDVYTYSIEGFSQTIISVCSADAAAARFHIWDGNNGALLSKEELLV